MDSPHQRPQDTRHRDFLGWADPLQSDPRREIQEGGQDTSDWRLLLQYGPLRADLARGDLMVVYFLAPVDPKTGRFDLDQVCVYGQCT